MLLSFYEKPKYILYNYKFFRELELPSKERMI